MTLNNGVDILNWRISQILIQPNINKVSIILDGYINSTISEKVISKTEDLTLSDTILQTLVTEVEAQVLKLASWVGGTR